MTQRQKLALWICVTGLSTISLTPFDPWANRLALVTLDPSTPLTREILSINQSQTPPYSIPNKYVLRLTQLTDEYQVPLWLVARLIQIESNWQERAINHNSNGTYDYGLFQLNSNYIEYFGWRYSVQDLNPFDWESSAEAAIAYLRCLYESTGSWYEAILAYNCGLSKLRSGSIPESSLRYADAIFAP
jgi:hypothetical protein